MTSRLLFAAIMSLGLGTGLAMAQTSTTQPDTQAAPGAQSDLPMGWEGAIGDAFFSDPAAGTLRTEDEARANWSGLTAEQQAQVRTQCENMDTAGAATDDQLTTSSVTPGTHMASIQRICDWVGDM